MALKKIKLSDLVCDAGTQVRVELNNDAVADYAEVYSIPTRHAKMPPLVAFWVDGRFILADGFHRLAALKKTTLVYADVDVRDGKLEDAIKYALQANSEHGLRRTNADKRNAVLIAFDKLAAQQFSDGVIAQMCAVSTWLVQSVRKEREPAQPLDSRSSDNGEGLSTSPPEKRIGRDGKQRTLPVPSAHPTKPKVREDCTGFLIPKEVLPLWDRAETVQGIIDCLGGIRGPVQSSIKKKDPLFAEVNQSELMASLDQVKENLERVLPYAVCSMCQGVLNVKDCKACRGRGFVSKHFWQNCVTDAKKELRKKAITKNATGK